MCAVMNDCAVRMQRMLAIVTLGLVLMSVIPESVHAANGTVVGNLTLKILPMPQYSDGRTRTIRIWTPANYDASNKARKYPVVYMHDGQNLFDAATSYAGEWRIDETITAMMESGYGGAIVVGIDNSADRLNELSPTWPRSSNEFIKSPSGDKYADFIVKTVKPFIDKNYNTFSDRAHTGVGGSSMGGIISFFIGLRYPAVFGKVLAFSPSFPLYASKKYLAEIAKHDFSKCNAAPRVYFYAGGAGDGAMSEGGIARSLPAVIKALKSAGYPKAELTSYVWDVAQHNEGFWAEVFPTAFEWLFLTDTDRAVMAAKTLALGFADGDSLASVTGDLTLDTAWDYGAKVSWKSNLPKVISARGKFTQPTTPQQVVLTATVTVGKVVRSRSFTVQILAR